MEYIITLFVCLALYTVGCVFLHRIPLRKEVVNVAFAVCIFVPYVYCVIAMYLDVGAHDWNFTNTLPTANVSPFTYCLAVISLFLPKKLQPYLFNLFALLEVRTGLPTFFVLPAHYSIKLAKCQALF